MTGQNERGPRVELSPATLAALDPRVAIPGYDRAALGAGIVHIGVGGFHRAHQAVYLDDLCRAGLDRLVDHRAPASCPLTRPWPRRCSRRTTSTRWSRATATARTCASSARSSTTCWRRPDLDPLVERLAQPETRIVSLTITEGGYPVDEATGAFLAPADGCPAAGLRGPGARRSRPAAMPASAASPSSPATTSWATATRPGRPRWASAPWSSPASRSGSARNVAFPNGMVDRITPQTAEADREFLATEYGLVDRWPVVAETFIQWVIEDEFPYGRPPYEDAGVLLTDDVRPYETLKLRILNAGHSTTTYMAALVGHVYIHEIMADPLLAPYMQRFHDDEATPSLPPVPGIDVEDYKRVVAERFANPEVRDQVARVCLDGIVQVPQVPHPDHRVAARQGRTGAALGAGAGRLVPVPAGQGRRRAATSCSRPIRGWSRPARSREASRSDPAAFLGFGEVFGQRLARRSGLPPGVRRGAHVGPRGGCPPDAGALARRDGLMQPADGARAGPGRHGVGAGRRGLAPVPCSSSSAASRSCSASCGRAVSTWPSWRSPSTSPARPSAAT